MNTLIANITKIYGANGKRWLDSIPQILQSLTSHWNLSDIVVVENMTYNYVVKALQEETPVVIKIHPDAKTYQEETNALDYFNGTGMVQCLDKDDSNHALLLQQLKPGVSLKEHRDKKPRQIYDIYADVIFKLHHQPHPENDDFKPISSWLSAIDNATSDQLPSPLITQARQLKSKLLTMENEQGVLHGDLHLDNIINDGNDWLSIDPKGIVGPIEFEVAAFDLITEDELSAPNIKKVLAERLRKLALLVECDSTELRDWFFLRCMLAACWHLEDTTDATRSIQFAQLILEG